MVNFEEMTTRELKVYAEENNIDISSANKKADIIDIIKQNIGSNNEEDVQMEEQNVNQELNKKVEGEMESAALQDNDPNTKTDVNANKEATTEDKKVWHDKAGNEVSMSQFIREKFTEDNLSRKEIADTYDINYRTVYGATVNMENAAEPSTRGRGVVNPKIDVTADNKVLTKVVTPAVAADPENGIEAKEEEIKFYLNGEEFTPELDEAGVAIIPDTVETDRNTWIKDQVAAGVNRGDVAKILDLSYGVVYGLTKEENGTRQKHEIEIEDPENPGQKKTIARSEYIRMRVNEGISKSDVAKELGVEYSVVWQATKKDKTDAEKFAETVEAIAKFADKIESIGDSTDPKTSFDEIIAALKLVVIKEEKKEETAETATTDEKAETTNESTTETTNEEVNA